MKSLCDLFKAAKTNKNLGYDHFKAESMKITTPRTQDMREYLTTNFDVLDASYVNTINDAEDDDDDLSSRADRAVADDRRMEADESERNLAKIEEAPAADELDMKSKTSFDTKSMAAKDPMEKEDLKVQESEPMIEEKTEMKKEREVERMVLFENLSRDYEEEDLIEFIKKEGLEGEVYYAADPYAIISMDTKSARDQIIANRNGAELLKKRMELSALVDRNRLFIGNLPKRLDADYIERDLEKQGGSFLSLSMKSGYCFITYDTGLEAHMAARRLRKHSIEGTRLTVEFAKPTRARKVSIQPSPITKPISSAIADKQPTPDNNSTVTHLSMSPRFTTYIHLNFPSKKTLFPFSSLLDPYRINASDAK